MKQITGVLKESRIGIRKIIREMDEDLKKKEILKAIDGVFVQVFEKSVEVKKNSLIVPKQQITKISSGFTKMLNHLYWIDAILSDTETFNKQMALAESNGDREETLENKLSGIQHSENPNTELLDYLSKTLPLASEKIKKFTEALDNIKISSGGSRLPDVIGNSRGPKKPSKIGALVRAIPKPVKVAVGIGLAVGAGTLAYKTSISKNKKDASREGREEGSSFVGRISQSVNAFTQGASEAFGIMPAGVGETGSAKEAISFFVSKGWTKEQSAGIVGNLQAESSPNLKTNSVGDGGKAYGIAQWHPDRQQTFSKVFKKNIRESKFQEQLSYVDWELKNTEKGAGNRLKSATTARDAAIIVDRFYERSSGEHRNQRIANATSLMGESKPAAFSSLAMYDATNAMIPDMFKNMSGAMVSPVGNARISSQFGMRVHPITKVKKMHAGVDYAVGTGTQIKAVDNGIVVSAGPAGGYGNLITVKHQNGLETRYAHLSSISVSRGQLITQGQSIGASGSTGASTGPHLHFEVRKDGVPINPLQFVGKSPTETDPARLATSSEPGAEQTTRTKTKAQTITDNALVTAYTKKSAKPVYVLLNPKSNTVIVPGAAQTKKKAGSNQNPASQYKRHLS